MIKTKGLVHFTIPVTDTARSREFYCRVLGMKLLRDTGEGRPADLDRRRARHPSLVSRRA
jgi:catechol 2,3-dioxygenase-like lactoylglutathione lyase family enzyme